MYWHSLSTDKDESQYYSLIVVYNSLFAYTMHFLTKQGYTNGIIPPFPNFKILQDNIFVLKILKAKVGF